MSNTASPQAHTLLCCITLAIVLTPMIVDWRKSVREDKDLQARVSLLMKTPATDLPLVSPLSEHSGVLSEDGHVAVWLDHDLALTCAPVGTYPAAIHETLPRRKDHLLPYPRLEGRLVPQVAQDACLEIRRRGD